MTARNRAIDATPAALSPAAALHLSHIGKRYGAVTALNDASLIVRPGTIHAVLGENGAGKTTLMRIAYGMVQPDAGQIRLADHDVRFASSADAIAAGIGMVHQHFTLVPAMTVAENLSLGRHGWLRHGEAVARVRALAQETGFALEPTARVETLSVGAQQRVEIAKALAGKAALLILDEPTAVLAPAEIQELIRWLHTYVASGNSVLLITHKLREALAVADDVTVLRRGRVVHTGAAASATVELLTSAMIGPAQSLDQRIARLPVANRPTVLMCATDITLKDQDGRVRIRNASFVIRAGELVGVAAVEGAGHRELLRALAGRHRIASGRLEGPSHIGFVPEDRHRNAILLDRSLSENMALRGAGVRRGLISWTAFHDRTAELLQEYDVRAPTVKAHMRTLSGGNQQKFAIARELANIPNCPVPNVLIVESPTRGLDVRATASVHQHLRNACQRGAAVVIYSSDIDEVLSLASRMLVVFEGTVHETPLDHDAIGRAMLGWS